MANQAPPFQLLETILYEPHKGFYLHDYHIRRLQASADRFGPLFARIDGEAVKEALLKAAQEWTAPYRVRLLYSASGEITVEATQLPPDFAIVQGVGTDNIFDVVLYNEHGHVTETAIANIAIQQPDGTWLTPPLSDGLLGGTMRAYLLEEGKLVEGTITLDQLRTAVHEGHPVKCFNSVRREYPVTIIAFDHTQTP